MRPISVQTAEILRSSELAPLGLTGAQLDRVQAKLEQSIDEAIDDVVTGFCPDGQLPDDSESAGAEAGDVRD